MKKITVVEYTERWSVGGIEVYILKLARWLDKDKFEIRIVAAQKETDIYDRELLQYGCRVESILPKIYPNPIERTVQNQKRWGRYFREHPCDVVHLHIGQGVALRYAKLAKKAGVRNVIAYSHNSDLVGKHRFLKMLGHRLGKLAYHKYIDHMTACSDVAARWLYFDSDIKKGNVRIIRIFVQTERFRFSEADRNRLRAEYGISPDTFVGLHIGRMSYQKNQIFLMDICREILKINENSRFVVIGTGELEEEIRSRAETAGLKEHILFIPQTEEVYKYMSMADAFILPSLFEGNPTVGIEAQASGLPCYFSDRITRQAKVLESSVFLPLEFPAGEWAKRIISDWNSSRVSLRVAAEEKVRESGYDIPKQISEIQKLYEAM